MAGLGDESLQQRLGAGLGLPAPISEIVGSIGHAQSSGSTSNGTSQFGGTLVKQEPENDDEEL